MHPQRYEVLYLRSMSDCIVVVQISCKLSPYFMDIFKNLLVEQCVSYAAVDALDKSFLLALDPDQGAKLEGTCKPDSLVSVTRHRHSRAQWSISPRIGFA